MDKKKIHPNSMAARKGLESKTQQRSTEPQVAAWSETHSAEELAELQELIGEQAKDDVYVVSDRRQHNGVRHYVLSLDALAENVDREGNPIVADGRPAHETRHSESGWSVSNHMCDITGARSSKATVRDRNDAHIDRRLNESPKQRRARVADEAIDGFLEVLGYGLVSMRGANGTWDGWLKRHRERGDAEDAFVRWVKRTMNHPDLEPGAGEDLVVGILGAWGEAEIVRRHKGGESVRTIERSTGVSKSEIQRRLSQHKTNETGEKMAVTNEDLLEEIQQLRREQGARFTETRDMLADLASRVRANHPNDTEVSTAVDEFLASIA